MKRDFNIIFCRVWRFVIIVRISLVCVCGEYNFRGPDFGGSTPSNIQFPPSLPLKIYATPSNIQRKNPSP